MSEPTLDELLDIRPYGDSLARRPFFISANLTDVLGVDFNREAQDLVDRAVQAQYPSVNSRVVFDSESDAFCVAGEYDDLVVVAAVIRGLAQRQA